MNKTILPVSAFALFFSAGAMLPCLAQSAGLPSTVMGKYVHMPGDNQYTNSTQATRHGAPLPMAAQSAPVISANLTPSANWSPAPKPFRPDPSIEPIAADEPVTPTGFPPLPDRLELPVQLSWSSNSPGGGGGGSGGGGGGGGYGGGGGGGGGGYGGGGGGGPAHATIDGAPQGMHEHYQHFATGAFIPADQQPGSRQAGPRENSYKGYYKCLQPEQFAADHHVNSDPSRALGLGPEPKLDGDEGAAAPSPPQAVVVNQTTTQDLSMPEDEFEQQKPPGRSKGAVAGRMVKAVGQQVLYTGLGVGMGMGMGMMRY